MQKQLRSITECPICTDTLTDPRSLPCIHTFCLECVKGFSSDKLPGDSVPCPVCRTEFTVPDKGVDGLPKNFFIQQLKDLTVTDGSHSEHNSLAQTDDASIKQIVINCKEHPHRNVEFFCFDCQSTICSECSEKSHKSHQYSLVDKVVHEFRNQMTAEIAQMIETVEECRDMLNVHGQNKTAFTSEVDGIRKEICDQVEQLMKVIDLAKHELLQELEATKQDRIKQIQHVSEDTEQHMSFLESLIQYTEELRDKGTPGDIAQQRKALHDRADELTKLNNIHRAISDLGSLKIKFDAVKIPDNGGKSVVGQVHRQLVEGNRPVFTFLSVMMYRNA
jgi:tripartite motif-containing protein 2/3